MTMRNVTPMIHVPDIRTAVEWYAAIGFTLLDTAEENGRMTWASMSFGAGKVMFNIEGRPSDQWRREVDLYVETSEIDALYEKLKGRVDVVEAPHDTFYGMREFIIRDLNRFWVTFGEQAASSGGRGD
jgi:uncharacterized glyoxalase superfamily protein PhnB